jgi:hypothetical protein
MLEPIRGADEEAICTCCGEAAILQDREGHTLFYCRGCAVFAAERTTDIALKALLAMQKADLLT